MIECLIVDDEPVARNIIRNYCEQLSFLHVAAECGNALDAKQILQAQSIDLLFLDIHMPVLNGISFLNTLKNPPQVIFTTAYQEHAVTAFDLAACDYLLKPFSLERFIVAVDKVKEKLDQKPGKFAENPQPTSKDSLFIKSEGKLHKIFFKDCLYAEAQGNYTKVVTTVTNTLTKISFSAFIDQLPGDLFIQVHRSFIVNKDKIRHIEGNRVFIQQTEIPIAGNYKEAFFRIIGVSS